MSAVHVGTRAAIGVCLSNRVREGREKKGTSERASNALMGERKLAGRGRTRTGGAGRGRRVKRYIDQILWEDEAVVAWCLLAYSEARGGAAD